MSPPLIELPIDRVEDAAKFLADLGCAVKAKQVRYTMSLLAAQPPEAGASEDADAIAGVAVACEVAEGRIDLFIAFDPQRGDLSLARALADKALNKVHAHGVHRCRIVPAGPADVREFWQQVNWLDQALGEPAQAKA